MSYNRIGNLTPKIIPLSQEIPKTTETLPTIQITRVQASKSPSRKEITKAKIYSTTDDELTSDRMNKIFEESEPQKFEKTEEYIPEEERESEEIFHKAEPGIFPPLSTLDKNKNAGKIMRRGKKGATILEPQLKLKEENVPKLRKIKQDNIPKLVNVPQMIDASIPTGNKRTKKSLQS